MLETKEQKGTLITVVVLILILSFVSFWGRQGFSPNNQQPQVQQEDSFLKSKAYLDYLASVKIDKTASDKLFKEILSEEEVRQEVEKALEVNQGIEAPEIAESSLNISSDTGKDAVENYLSEVLSQTIEFSNDTVNLSTQLFNGDLSSSQELLSKYSRLYERLKAVEVPREVLVMHKSVLRSYVSYGDLLQTSKAYAAGKQVNPWPDIYHDYVVINDEAKVYRDELEQIAGQYDIASVTVKIHYAEGEEDVTVPFTKTAQAFLGLGDLSITIGDIPRLIWDAIKEGLASSFSQFMGSMIANLLQKIEDNYLIANFLYYTDALVQGQYSDDYLNKYVDGTLDREIIKTFIPQFACGAGNEFLAPVFQAKANEHLGFDVESLDPSDPDFYSKSARVGEFLSSPQGWKLHYQDVANAAKSEAEKSAERELASSGLKTPRDSIERSISQSISSIVSAQRAGFNNLLNLGIANADKAISAFISTLTQVLVDKFVFRGVTAGDSIGVILEQPTCVATAQLQLILPLENSEYVAPPPPPDQDQLIQQECAKNPSACFTGYIDCYNQTGDSAQCCGYFPESFDCIFNNQ